MSEDAAPVYPAASHDKMLAVAEQCRKGQNSNRFSFAAEIERGDL